VSIPDSATLIAWSYALAVFSIASLSAFVVWNLMRWARAAKQEEQRR